MWSAWQDLKTYHRRPSVDLELDDPLIALCTDRAVTWFGITVENALLERVDVGSGKDKRSEAKYSLEELLDPAFALSRPQPAAKKQPAQNVIGAMMAMDGMVKKWIHVKPS